MLKKIFAISVLLSIAGLARAGSLDGTTWKIRVKPDLEAKRAHVRGFTDTLTFSAGTVEAASFVKLGFLSATYEASSTDFATSWSSHQKDVNQGVCRWEGKVMDNKINGTLVWTKPNGKPVHYAFKGKKS